jgi:membrane protease YdiL (CAAX protease family)
MTSQPKPRIRYGWLRAALGLVTFLVIYFGISSTVNLIDKSNAVGGDSLPRGLLTSVVIVNFSFFITSWLLRKFVDRQSVASLGFKWNGRYALIGMVVGFAVIGAGTFFLWVVNYLQFIGADFLSGAFFFNLLVFALVAFGEELFFRGYILNNLLQSMNKWLALATSAVVFMAMHLENPGAAGSFMPIISLIMGGLLLGINYMYTCFALCMEFSAGTGAWL